MATVAARTIVDGMDRSTLPGPSVMTNIWPMATSVEEAAEREGRRGQTRPGLARW